MCGKWYKTPQGLASHARATGHQISNESSPPDLGSTLKRVRTEYSAAVKDLALTRYFELEKNPKCACPHTQTCKELWPATWQNRKGYLTRWRKEADTIRQKVAIGRKEANRKRMRREVVGLGGWFPAQQDELYLRVYTRRVEYGYPVNHFWLQTEFRSILEETKPDGYDRDTFKCSWGWAVKFCIRYNLSTQAGNNIKAHDQVDRE